MNTLLIRRMVRLYIYIYIVIHRHYYCLHTSVQHIYIYIYIYIFTNLISTSIHGTRKKQKTPGQEQEIKISRITAQRKKKKVFWLKKKEKTNLVRLLEKNQGVLSQWSKENQKTLRECCNATITKVLNIKQWSQL